MTLFLRRHFVRIVIGTVLAAAAFGTLCVYVPFQLERSIVTKIEALGGHARFEYRGPNWIPRHIQDLFPLLDRVVGIYQDGSGRMRFTDADLELLKGLTSLTGIDLDKTQITDAGLEQLKGMVRVEWLVLDHTSITDIGLEHISGLSNIGWLQLNETQVTDAGLSHLTRLASLKILRLRYTGTTAEGRALLRKALPNCQIEPDP